MSRKGFIYFISDEEAGLVKIGFSTNVARRFASIKSERKDNSLTLLASYEGDTDSERDEHRAWGHLREIGEWFRSHPDLVSYINSLAPVVGEAKNSDPFTDTAREWVAYLERRESERTGEGGRTGNRAAIAKRCGVTPGMLENLYRGRVVHIACIEYAAIKAEVISEKTKELEEMRELLEAARRGGLPDDKYERGLAGADAASRALSSLQPAFCESLAND